MNPASRVDHPTAAFRGAKLRQLLLGDADNLLVTRDCTL
jgi:hypothetical protein